MLAAKSATLQMSTRANHRIDNPPVIFAEGKEMSDQTKFDIPALREKMLRLLADNSQAYPHHLEQRFPHVLEKLTSVWGTPAADPYLQSLMVTDRSDRQGFPMDVASEILRLSMLHDVLRPATLSVKKGWSAIGESELQDSFDRRSNR